MYVCVSGERLLQINKARPLSPSLSPSASVCGMCVCFVLLFFLCVWVCVCLCVSALGSMLIARTNIEGVVRLFCPSILHYNKLSGGGLLRGVGKVEEV